MGLTVIAEWRFRTENVDADCSIARFEESAAWPRSEFKIQTWAWNCRPTDLLYFHCPEGNLATVVCDDAKECRFRNTCSVTLASIDSFQVNLWIHLSVVRLAIACIVDIELQRRDAVCALPCCQLQATSRIPAATMARSVVVAGLVSAWARVAVAQTEPQLALSWCNGGPSQQWYYDTQNTTIVLASNGFCIDVLAYGTTPGSEVYSNPCHHDDHDPTHQNQEFSAPARSGVSATPIIETMSGLAIDAGSVLGLVSLTNASIASAFFLNVTSPANNGTGPLIHVNSGLCLDANAPSSGQPTTALTLMQCGDDQMNVERQVFSLTAVSGAVSTVFQTPYNATLCMSVDINPASGVSGLISAPCPPPSVAVPAFQGFSLDPNGHLVSAVGNEGMVAAVDASTGLYAGMPLHLDETDAAGGTVFVFNTTNSPAGPGTGRLVHATSGLCLNAGPLPNSHACLTPATRVLPFCNASLPAEARVADLISRLTLQEKIALTGSGHWPSGDSCDTIDPGVARLGIPSVQWLVETNSMVASQCYGSTCATLFPSALNLAASFNRSVWRAKGEAVSDEMRAMNNLGWHRGDTQSGTQISLNGFGPDINQPRDPRNGRIGELASEDPFLTGQYAVEYVQGMQVGGYVVMPDYLLFAAGSGMRAAVASRAGADLPALICLVHRFCAT